MYLLIMHITYRYNQIFRLISILTSSLVALIGLTVLLGWLFDIQILKGAVAANIQMKTNTAFCFLLTGTGIFLQNILVSSRTKNLFTTVLGWIVVAIGTFTLLEHATGFNFRIDEMLHTEPFGEVATTSPNRMGPPAALCFAYAGLALVFIAKRTTPYQDYASCLGILIGIVSALPILGYMFGSSELFAVAKLTGIALSSAVSLLFLSAAIIFSCFNGSLLQLMKAQNAGGFLLRRMIGPALLLPVTLAYMRTLGEAKFYYDASFGRALMVLAFTIVFTAMLISSARILRQTDEERKDLLESERAARTEAEKASRMKDEFLATLSHELRTPLNAILGWAQILKRGKLSEAEHQKGIETIERNARIQAQFIEEMLDMSRAIAGKLVLNVRLLELISLLRSCVQTVLPSAASKNITIKTNFVLHTAKLSGDTDRLIQVFSNLLTNAIKFTPAGGVIIISSEKVGNSVEIRVGDNGQGIKREFLDHLFDRFRQADGSITRRFGGLGIGLSIVRDLVTLHGGTVKATSEGEGKGSIFSISLPLDLASTQEEFPQLNKVESSSGAPGVAAAQIELRGIRVLVVDDNAETRELVRRILESYNAEVILASSAEEGLRILEKQHPDILVSDIGMPDQDGYEFIKNVRKLPSRKSIPAIALTAFARDHDKIQAFNAGYQYHISKPIEAGELLNAIANGIQIS